MFRTLEPREVILRHSHVCLNLRRPPPSCLALWSDVRLSSGTPTFTNSYDGSLAPPFSFTTATIFFYLSLRRQPPFCFTMFNHVRFSSDTPTFTNPYGGSHHRPLRRDILFLTLYSVGFLLGTPTRAVDLQVQPQQCRGRGGPRLLFNLDFFLRHFHFWKAQL